MKDNAYVRSFLFGLKLFFLLSLLLLPIVLFISTCWLPNTILEKTFLYKKPLVIDNVWLAEDLKKLSVDKKDNAVYEFKFKDGQSTTITRSSREAIYHLGEPTETGEKFYVKTNRAGNDAEMQKLTNSLNDRLDGSYYNSKEVWNNIRTSNGYYADLTVEYGGLNLIGNIINIVSIVTLVIVCLALYFPLIKAIIALFKNRKRKNI